MELSSSDDADGDGGSGTGALENTQPQQPRVAHAGRMNNEWCRLCLVKSIVFIRYNRPLHLNNRIYMQLATEPFVASLRFFQAVSLSHGPERPAGGCLGQRNPLGISKQGQRREV